MADTPTNNSRISCARPSTAKASMDRTDLNQKMLAALIHRPFGNINADKDGGGYFDRTLAALVPRPCAVGIGFHSARLATVFPHLHDIPMDVIPTEVGIQYQSGTS